MLRRVAKTVRLLGTKMKRRPRWDLVRFAIDGQRYLSFEHIAQFLALVRNRFDPRSWRHHMDGAFEEVTIFVWKKPFKADAVDIDPCCKALFGIKNNSRWITSRGKQGRYIRAEADGDPIKRLKRWICVTVLNFREKAL